uniref:(California timema) hypothetical protein n=1 Tax=Timema californicum TaxID=61474 RepID=A0A7R9J8T9_TIMCA|nr:unnamed protein product [Timema californicum]
MKAGRRVRDGGWNLDSRVEGGCTGKNDKYRNLSASKVVFDCCAHIGGGGEEGSSGDTVSSCSSISSYGSAEGDLGPLTVFSFIASAHPYSGSPAPPFREGLLLQSKEKGGEMTEADIRDCVFQ